MAEVNWLGQTLGERYQIRELLGHGGMSSVYKAFDPNLKREVAVKIIHSHLTGQADFVERFEREAASVAQLRHSNIIQVHDFSREGNVYYIVFEYVAGETLQERLRRLSETQQFMSIAEVKKITIALANAIEYAHSKSIVHRDIKPANVILNNNNEPILMDFGITKILGGGKHTATGITVGTVQYMSPEQIKGEDVDARTDIYALGITLYEMLGGRAPFEANSTMALMMMHVQNEAPDPRSLRPDIPSAFVDVVQRAIAKEPRRRYQRTADLARDVSWIKVDTDGLQTVVDYADPFETMMDAPLQSAPRYQPTPAPASKPHQYQATDVVLTVPLPPPSIVPSGQKNNKKMGVLLGIAALVLFGVILAGASFFFLSGPNVDTLLAEAQEAIEQGEYAQAEENLELLLAEEPKNPTFNLLMGTAVAGQERFADSLPYYDTAIAQDDGLVDAYLGAGQATYELENHNRSLEYFTDAILLSPGNAEAHAGQGENYYALGWLTEAISPLEKWASLDSKVPQPLQRLSSIYEETGDLQKQLEINRQWIERDPQSADAHSALGWAYYGLDRFDDALASFSQALARNSELPSAYRGLGHVHYAMGQYEEAIQNYNKWLEYDSENPNVYNSLGWSYYNNEQYTDALDAFSVALRLNPDLLGANQGIGYLYEQQGDYERSVTYYRNWADLSSDQVQPYSRLGWALFELGEYTEAVAAFEQIILLDPINVSGHKGLAYSYKQLQNGSKTYEYQLKWADVAASDPEAHTQLGWTLYERQDFESAARSFSTALALNPEHYSALSGRGQAYFYSGENGCMLAVSDFEAALRIRPNDNRISELLTRCQE